MAVVFKTTFQEPVSSALASNLVSDRLELDANRLFIRLDKLPRGSYDVKFYFHQADASAVHDSLGLFDTRSPNGFTMSTNIRSSIGTDNPIISTFTFPLESNGEDTIYINLSSNNPSIKTNGLNPRYTSEVLSNGIEIIPRRRYGEALITAYLGAGLQLYGCLGNDSRGLLRLGSYSEESDICSSLATDSPKFN